MSRSCVGDGSSSPTELSAIEETPWKKVSGGYFGRKGTHGTAAVDKTRPIDATRSPPNRSFPFLRLCRTRRRKDRRIRIRPRMIGVRRRRMPSERRREALVARVGGSRGPRARDGECQWTRVDVRA